MSVWSGLTGKLNKYKNGIEELTKHEDSIENSMDYSGWLDFLVEDNLITALNYNSRRRKKRTRIVGKQFWGAADRSSRTATRTRRRGRSSSNDLKEFPCSGCQNRLPRRERDEMCSVLEQFCLHSNWTHEILVSRHVNFVFRDFSSETWGSHSLNLEQNQNFSFPPHTIITLFLITRAEDAREQIKQSCRTRAPRGFFQNCSELFRTNIFEIQFHSWIVPFVQSSFDQHSIRVHSCDH